jgi:hypothetical protein
MGRSECAVYGNWLLTRYRPGWIGHAELTAAFLASQRALLSLPCKSANHDAEVVARREDGSPTSVYSTPATIARRTSAFGAPISWS